MEQQITDLIVRLRSAEDAEREAIRAELEALCRGPQGRHARELVESAARREVLEVQWELEEVLEVTAPPKPAPAEPPKAPPKAEEPPPADPQKGQRLSAKDLDLIYDDPRGLALHRTKDGKRWFATQVDPYTRQPQTFELHPSEITQIKTQLQGSPYWLLGAGA